MRNHSSKKKPKLLKKQHCLGSYIFPRTLAIKWSHIFVDLGRTGNMAKVISQNVENPKLEKKGPYFFDLTDTVLKKKYARCVLDSRLTWADKPHFLLL